VTLLAIWIAAGIAVFLPFAVGTSPLDALMLRVPGSEGNWWHVLVGAPFVLSIPMIWLRLRALASRHLSTESGRRVIWATVAVSICGTLLVEAPFLLHLAGTSERQRVSILALGFGIIVASAAALLFRYRTMDPTRRCLIGLNTAYLANAFLCLVVYGEGKFSGQSRSGWFVTMVIVWPMLLELLWLLIGRPSAIASRRGPVVVAE
jgi:hypothetical protein